MKYLDTLRPIQSGLAILLGLSASNLSHAGITQPVTIDFQGMNVGQPGASAAYYGKANVGDTAVQGCKTAATKCYFEDGFSVGSVIDPADPNAHLHRGGTVAARAVEYHGDSGGIYIRADDLSAFSFDSFTVDTRNTGTNPAAGSASSQFEVLGFAEALDANLATHNWSADPTYGGKRIAYQTFPNANSVNTIVLGDAFKNVKAVWIHYSGYPRVPTDGVEFDIKVNNIKLSAPPASPTPTCP